MPKIYNMNEMAIWSDMVSPSTVDKTGSRKSIKLKPFTPNEKLKCWISNFTENVSLPRQQVHFELTHQWIEKSSKPFRSQDGY